MKVRRIVPVLLVALLIPGPGTAPARASSPEELFAAGNDAYEKERFEEAAAAYEKILDYGLRDPRV
ncbi:MAG TPA: hypothetical protein VFT43_12335, partial [Candidatus Polarisedimenticolia bacterium]|nr:hypothetical protein [Candidatus Polarisedimenticolia bacterium]